ncbi:efflux RND transporter permease subunit [Roseinatronobacter sp. S2]|uniref:efflux RND transporter permease subunit n=1 Tax=Roseinatronobacter sp. S2 TaxID=3035471 RepID=UPI00240F94F9|nr:efflux RND transporter permease subunit [Roseinatronobacter sp. S2]WFE77097.1 efflux RND transporter permease subunit [Roseinatronobacter sp. S2]
MNIARASIDKALLTWILILGCLLGGLWGFNSLGRLEDPAFTIKTAVIMTQYPGSSADQVAREVSEPLESAIQKMAEVDIITSVNRPGLSLIEVEIKDSYDGSALPAVWVKLRNRISDAARNLPQGVSTPLVNDTFGDVFGLYYAVTAEGLSAAEKHQLATFLRRELLAVDGVADVDVAGLPAEAIYVEPDMARAVNQGVAPQAIAGAIANANSVLDAGAADIGPTRTLIQSPDGSDSVSAIAGLSVGVGGQVLNLFDMAHVYRGEKDHPSLIVRHDGQDAFTLGIAGVASDNIVDVGKRVDIRLAQLQADIPYGVNLHPIYQQHVVVEDASNAFLLNLLMSVSIVVVVLALFMGWRAAVVVGSTLLLTVIGTLFFMGIFSIEMERISLGALIIAMGMLVDNAIVVAEGMQIAMRRGKSSREAADEAAGKTQIPLLGATVIGIMAFAGIGLSPDATGEFMFSLFAVIAISLLLSWVLAVTATPLLAHYLFKQGTAGDVGAYDGRVFKIYGSVVHAAIKARWLVVGALLAVTAVCYIGFGQVKQQFFPDSNTPLFFVHYKLPQGNAIHTTSEHLAKVESWLASRDEVVSVTAFAGDGAARFMLTYSAEKANPSYGHLIIRTHRLDEIPALKAELDAFARATLPEGEFRSTRLAFGPGGGDPIQLRLSGSDPQVLRELGVTAAALMQQASPHLHEVRNNWREQELVLKPLYASDRAQAAGITRDDISDALLFATDGTTGGVYREDERLIPIIVRQPRSSGLGLMDQVVYSSSTSSFMPIEQVIDGLVFEPQNTLLHRRNRELTLTLGADVAQGQNAAAVQAEIRGAVEAMPLPIGYRMEWGGELENSAKATSSLARQLPFSLIVMVLISVFLFSALRQPLIIWLLVPMSVNGVVVGLLLTGIPFSFTALLGLLSLSGMLIKNGIVLVEEIDLVRAEGIALRDAIVTACVSRLRPVVLAAATTILGMAPLLWDAFFVSMSVTIMAGLAFASVLTLIAVPVFYYLLFEREEGRRVAAGVARADTPRSPTEAALS